MEPFLNLGTRGCNPHPAPCKPRSPEHWRTRKWRHRKHAADISELLLSANMVPGAARAESYAAPAWALPPATSIRLSAGHRRLWWASRAQPPQHWELPRWSEAFVFFMVNTTVFIYLFNVTVSGWSHVNSLGFTWRHSWEQAYSPLSFLSHPQRQEIILAKNGQWEKECFTTLYMRNKGIKILTRFFFLPKSLFSF